MKKIATSLIFKNINIPVVEFELSNGVNARGIIDTGSESTVIDAKFIKENKDCFSINATNEKMNFVGFYGNDNKKLIKITSNLTFKNKKQNKKKNRFQVPLIDAIAASIDNINNSMLEMYGEKSAIQVIFGSDFLSQTNTIIDYKNKELIFC